MNLTTLQAFRSDVYRCLLRARDALFETIDALVASPQARSFPELSESPSFRRRWPSLYEAFEDGIIDEQRLREVFVQYMPQQPEGQRLVLAVDATSIERPCSHTSADRTAVPLHNIPHIAGAPAAKAISFGWQFSTLTVLPTNRSSWTYILDQRRIPSNLTPIEQAFQQLKDLWPILRKRPLVLHDRGYDANWYFCKCSTLPLDSLIRVKTNRCFYRRPPVRKGKVGRPAIHGAKLQPSDSGTHVNPSGLWSGLDDKGRKVEVKWWEQMHVHGAAWLEFTVIQVSRPHASDSERDPRISWFVFIRGDLPAEVDPQPGISPEKGDIQENIPEIALLYCLRFSHEHGYRFDKQSLLWTAPHLRTPAQFERWSHIVAIAHNMLTLARDLVIPERQPWENKRRVPTPQHVRRGLIRLLPQLGTPASPPKTRGLAKGRSCGTRGSPAPRHPVVRKTAKIPQLVPT